MTQLDRTPRTSGYADVNGLHMYYEVHGGGSPLVLLHGGMLTIDLNFAGLIPGSQLAVLPGTTHMQVTRRADLLLPMLAEFLD